MRLVCNHGCLLRRLMMLVLDLFGNWNLYTKPASDYVAVLVNAVLLTFFSVI
jgi:hypothetical protein